MSTASDRKRDRFWRQLLPIVAQGNAVPIVGEELLQVSDEPDSATLYGALATRFAEQNEIKVEAALAGNLSAVVRSHPDFSTRPDSLPYDVAAAYEEYQPQIPAALLALAKIRSLNLFVTTTFDDLLERALNQERYAGQKRTRTIPFSPKKIPDDQAIASALLSNDPVIFQYFGSYTSPGQFAITEADMVEYVHALETNQKTRLAAELYERPLLLLGNSFPDWLTRILLRLGRNKRLDDREQKPVYVVDAQVAADPRLRFFLNNFVANTQVADEMSAREFVSELYERWNEKYGSQDQTNSVVASDQTRPARRAPVFISYCRTKDAPDAQIAIAIRDGLKARGVDVWLDQDELQAGDQYELDIRKHIEEASLFVPLISQTTDARGVAYFRKEWTWAIEMLAYRQGNPAQFIVPVYIGPTDWRPRMMPPQFKPYQYVRLTGDTPDTKFLDRLQILFEQAQVAL